jgi:GTP diphosphokinase / guanosine-3',5'-bis(diphosphate) 3'-diphosphatase
MQAPSYKKYFDIDRIVEDIQSYLPKFDRDKFKEAFAFAEEAHRGQMRKDAETPYIVHPVRALEILVDLKADEDTLISTLLHDVPEDTERTIEDVKENFGETVAFLVNGITKLSKVQYQHNMPQRQVESLKKLLLHSADDLRVILIKLADRLHNMTTLGNIPQPEKRVRIATETLEIYVPIANLLGIRDLKFQLEDLCFKHLFPTEYAAMHQRLEKSLKMRSSNIHDFINQIQTLCDETGIKVKIEEREKNVYSIYKKLCSLGRKTDELDDRVAVNIVVNSIPECYQVLGIIHTAFVPKPNRFKDYIANPKVNGYRSIHTAVFGVEGKMTEMQIRTEEMDIEAEYGIIANFFFKQGDKKDHSFSAGKKGSSWLTKIIDLGDNEGGNGDFLETLKSDFFQDRIFVFTPKGDVIDLPKGATVIDFAYAIHSQVGNNAARADVNSVSRPISSQLKTGDLVNVISSKTVSPELAWTSFAKTSQARNNIVASLKRESKDKKIKQGRKILQREFDISGLGIFDKRYFRKIKKSLKKVLGREVKSPEDLFVAIGQGELRARDLVQMHQHSDKGDTDSAYKYMEPTNVDGQRVRIKVLAKNSFGLMRDIAEIMYNHALDMYTFKGWSSKHEVEAYYSVDILVKDVGEVSNIIDELEQIEDVDKAYRVSRKGVFLAGFLTMMIAGAWMLHPIILNWISNTELHLEYPRLVNLFIYGGLTGLLLFVLVWGHVMKRYFPLSRNRRLLWLASFIVPVISVITLGIELIIFDLHLSWMALTIESLMIYGYLGMSYYTYKKDHPDR